ncbi:MAG TPA: CerR family C-terminal domain-containing protein [Verrucomicrobiae bacterium]|nr:CerR family C-terminal domain-containing protein [Verrucomicrobiae bacterium]
MSSTSTLAPPRPRRRPSDAPTREKLLDAAAEVFAHKGYYKATIREICRRAGANVAAVNYTFGDKLGLYTEVLRQLFRTPERARLNDVLDSAGSPEELLRHVIFARLQSLCERKRPDWGFNIVMHEFSEPTPAMTRVVDEGMRPIYERVLKAVGEIIGLPAEHETTRLCNNSIMGQVIFYTYSQPVLSRLQPDLKLTPERLERIAGHIAEFTLAALQQMARHEHEHMGSPKLTTPNGGAASGAIARNSRRPSHVSKEKGSGAHIHD